MYSPIIISTFLALTTTLRPVSALGINCRGSSLCHLASWDNANSQSIIQILRDAVWASAKANSTVYASGEHIICVSSSQPVTLDASAGVTADGASVSGSFGLSGTIHEGGICLFPQGAALTLEEIRPLTDAVLEHGCGTCGSVPVHFVDQGSNDPAPGILTFNYVKNPYCDGNCISSTGTAKSRVRRVQGSYPL